jgi:predicted MFS family arabinose efflux permease
VSGSFLAHLLKATTQQHHRVGLFTAGYGVFWFLGSAIIGLLYDVSLPATIAFCLVAELAAVPFFLRVARSRSSIKAGP